MHCEDKQVLPDSSNGNADEHLAAFQWVSAAWRLFSVNCLYVHEHDSVPELNNGVTTIIFGTGTLRCPTRARKQPQLPRVWDRNNGKIVEFHSFFKKQNQKMSLDHSLKQTGSDLHLYSNSSPYIIFRIINMWQIQ